ncbi:MAG: ATP-binding protein [Lewinella sp.]|nr:ATP-binding protein [Lewinella sp.]
MEEKELINFVRTQIEESQAGATKEYQKLDFKREWKDLNDVENRNEFLKDISAMANTFGPDGFIIIGYDDKTKSYHDAVFGDCGIDDESKLNQMIGRYLSHTFDINFRDILVESHQLSVLHIPETYEPSYFIKNYITFDKQKNSKQSHNQIFIRKGSRVGTPDKYDIDYMYKMRYGRTKKRDFDPAIEIIDLWLLKSLAMNFVVSFLVENKGLNPFAIMKAEIIYQGPSNYHGFENHHWYKNGSSIKNQSIVIPTGTMEEIQMNFMLPDEEFFKGPLLRIYLRIFMNGGVKKEFIIADQARDKAFKEKLLANVKKMPNVI